MLKLCVLGWDTLTRHLTNGPGTEGAGAASRRSGVVRDSRKNIGNRCFAASRRAARRVKHFDGLILDSGKTSSTSPGDDRTLDGLLWGGIEAPDQTVVQARLCCDA
jgi:hypothetical protein